MKSGNSRNIKHKEFKHNVKDQGKSVMSYRK